MLAKRADYATQAASMKWWRAIKRGRGKLHALVLAVCYFQHCLQSEAGKEARAYLDQSGRRGNAQCLGWLHRDALAHLAARKPPDCAAGLCHHAVMEVL